MDKIKKLLRIALHKKIRILIILSVAVFITCAFLIIKCFIPKKDGLSSYRRFENESNIVEDGISISQNPVDFDEIQKVNPDVCAWIRVAGTNIDYPILRSASSSEENFYLNHDYKRNESASGSIYIQRYNSGVFTDPNTIIYGHEMLNGTMFAQLKKFKNKDFFDENSEIKIYMPKHINTYKIFSMYLSDDRHILSTFQFYDENSYNAFVNECTNPKSNTNNVRKGVVPAIGDRLITLSTCTGNEKERIIVAGVLLSEVSTK